MELCDEVTGHSFSRVAQILYAILQEANQILMRQKKLNTQQLKLIFPADSPADTPDKITEMEQQMRREGKDANLQNVKAVEDARKLFLDELDEVSLKMFYLFEGYKLIKKNEKSIAAKEKSIAAKTTQTEARKRKRNEVSDRRTMQRR
jgi:hypothetical protein